MRNLPRTKRVLTTQVNIDTAPAPDGRMVLAVGRFRRLPCENCGDFKAVKVVIGGPLVTCSECVAPTAGLDDVMDDVEGADDAKGYETEDLFAGWAA
ncbi:hypothetical protein [Streptomyces chartreusis]|uniref:Uncharacterized protein n=1 Tax=Streptomyces chartreusis TaxID=1969 RepID=A0A7H8TB48_STRCX|nr:hypothetical protein [Streptomyces chartreusis]QKZ20584.1 hypothetical protein HUT05_26520 [Streptomyces chartreusis]